MPDLVPAAPESSYGAEQYPVVANFWTVTAIGDVMIETSNPEGARMGVDTWHLEAGSYGLQAGIFTARLDTALRAARELHYGTVLINEVPTWRADQIPYGGVRESGNTKEGPPSAVREMTEERLVVIGT